MPPQNEDLEERLRRLGEPVAQVSDKAVKESEKLSSLESYKKNIRILLSDETFTNLCGVECLKEGDTEAAIRELQRAIMINPEYALAYCNLAGCYYKKG